MVTSEIHTLSKMHAMDRWQLNCTSSATPCCIVAISIPPFFERRSRYNVSTRVVNENINITLLTLLMLLFPARTNRRKMEKHPTSRTGTLARSAAPVDTLSRTSRSVSPVEPTGRTPRPVIIEVHHDRENKHRFRYIMASVMLIYLTFTWEAMRLRRKQAQEVMLTDKCVALFQIKATDSVCDEAGRVFYLTSWELFVSTAQKHMETASSGLYNAGVNVWSTVIGTDLMGRVLAWGLIVAAMFFFLLYMMGWMMTTQTLQARTPSTRFQYVTDSIRRAVLGETPQVTPK